MQDKRRRFHGIRLREICTACVRQSPCHLKAPAPLTLRELSSFSTTTSTQLHLPPDPPKLFNLLIVEASLS